jgi:hypothetical protein
MYVCHNLTAFCYICCMKDEQVKQLNSTIIKLLSDFEREHNVTIDGVTIVVNDSVYKGTVCRNFSIETSYNEKE